jgi:amino acid permease
MDAHESEPVNTAQPIVDYGTLKSTHAPAPLPVVKTHGSLHRGLSARHVQMIAIGGTIGTGLFLGTGRSLAQGGPASMLICYGIVGFVVYVTLLLLGEMATQYPVAGKFPAPVYFPAARVSRSHFHGVTSWPIPKFLHTPFHDTCCLFTMSGVV